MALLAGAAVADHKLFQQAPLYAPGVAVQADGSVADLQPGQRLVPGSRVSDGSWQSVDRAARQSAWLAAGRVPAIPELTGSDLVEAALLDLHVLTQTHQVTVAAWTPAWRYVWPRDSAFVAGAFARTGHLTEAQALLDFLMRVQPADGVFQARYRPDGVAPDDRGRELDGSGWALWSLGEVVDEQSDPRDRRRLIGRYRTLLDRSVSAIVASTGGGQHLPAPSRDYWEVPERRLTLATCAPLLAGLRAASRLYDELGEDAADARTRTLADRMERMVLQAFGDDGFPRRLGGAARTVDLGLTFLLPPFAGVEDARAYRAWQAAPRYLTRPAGGLAPGGSWPSDGVSWTPATATWALTASCLDPAQAIQRVQWLDRYRTPAGALPEKVLADGSPASVAPLAWSAAAVILTVDRLERGCSEGAVPKGPG